MLRRGKWQRVREKASQVIANTMISNIARALAYICDRPHRAGCALALLCLIVYLPGVLRLPAVDRTEIIYAETTRSMVERGAWGDPRYGGTVHQFRPIGTYWAQGLAATLAGPSHARDIAVYRLPGMIAVTLAVLALFWLSLPLIGVPSALIASALFAVAPLTVLLAQLAITEGLALLPATVAMLALWRIYAGGQAQDARLLSCLFWIAIGVAMMLNALQTPILIATTLAALVIFDRDLRWLRKTYPLVGLPLALAIASPWIIVRWHQDGVPFAGLSWSALTGALGGSQDMKLRAWPGTFVIAALLGFLPGTAFLAPAALKLWDDRVQRSARFLFCWMAGYIVYLEGLSSKPGTYAVQVLFPAFAIAVAMLIKTAQAPIAGQRLTLPWALTPSPLVSALFALSLFAAIYIVAPAAPTFLSVLAIAAVLALFYWSAGHARAGRFDAWGLSGVAALGLFAVTLLSTVLPSIGKFWPARELNRMIEVSCRTPVSIGILGWREPSASFALQADRNLATPQDLIAQKPGVQIIESRWLERYFVASAAHAPGAAPGQVIGCVSGFNTMRGCPVSFTVFSPLPNPSCAPSTLERCDSDQKVRPRPPSQSCD